MLIAHKDIYCGLFESSIVRGNITESDIRTVECFELEIFHLTGGVSHINGETYPTEYGMFVCAKPGQIRYSNFPVKCSFIRIFKNEYTPKALTDILSSLPNCTYIKNKTDIENLLALLSNLASLFTATNVKTLNEVLINSLFYDFLHKLLDILEGEETKPTKNNINPISLQAYEYINENLTSDCSLKKLAKAVNVSQNYLQTTFTKSFGISPYKYCIIKRIEKAKKMIAVGDKSILEISLELGFCSQSHFNRIFKKITGKTPKKI
jgi:AraC-like DNA-binding protein